MDLAKAKFTTDYETILRETQDTFRYYSTHNQDKFKIQASKFKSMIFSQLDYTAQIDIQAKTTKRTRRSGLSKIQEMPQRQSIFLKNYKKK